MIQDKILGCFLGKTIGGTMGARHEGRNGFLHLTGYDPVPDGAIPNDDFDLQLVWLAQLKKYRRKLDYQGLAEGWLKHIDFHPDEYGVAIGNLKKQILPPVSGLHNNFFTDGIGGAIRTEIWSSVHAGNPAAAAYWAALDASVDHAGNGVVGTVFIALLEADLFRSGDLRQSIEFARQNIPGGKFRTMVEDAIGLFDGRVAYAAARQELTARYWSANFTDICMNGAYILLGLLYGEGDFRRSLLLSVNCGQDVDCTGATVGAIMGILRGGAGIDPDLAAPVGEKIVVGDYIKDLEYPETLSALVSEILELQKSFTDSPECALPYVETTPQDVSEHLPWRVNGEARNLPSGILNLQELGDDPYCEITLETTVTSPRTQRLYLMLCARGLSSVFLDGVRIAQLGNYGEMVPGFHRVAGGSLTMIEFNSGVPRMLRLGIFTHNLSIEPHAYIGFCDANFRHCTDLEFKI